MRTNRIIPFVKVLMKQEGYIKSEELCAKLSISPRTLRDDIAKFKEELKEHGMEVLSKQGTGYRLHILEEEKYYAYIAQLLKEEEDAQRLLPVYPEDRINYLIKLFLNANAYIKLDDIADRIYISKSTLQNDMKEVRERLQYFHLDLVSRPGSGMKIIGSEMHKRSCISQYFFHTESMEESFVKRAHMNEQENLIHQLLLETLNETDFRLSDIGFQNLIIHISIALQRNQEGHNEDLQLYADLQEKKEYEIAKRLVTRLEEAFSIHLQEIETYYITIHLMGKKSMQFHREYTITQEIESLLTHVFVQIKEQYGYDFSSDFELYTVLALHFQPMLNRLKYGLMMQNPLLLEIKQENQTAFEVAVLAAKVIQNDLTYEMNEDEIGYLALHFALAMERSRKQQHQKKNIIIVCASGAGSSQILLYKIKQRFGDDLNRVYVSELYKLPQLPQKEYDFILSTVPVPFPTDIPVIEVQYFLNEEDVYHISEAFAKTEEDLSFIDQYFHECLFFTDLKGKTREEILHEMIQRIAIFEELDPQFEALVMEREQFAATEFGNFIAMPHPIRPICKRTFVSVGILKKPIRWQKQLVRYIFLMGIEKDCQEDLNLFHETIAALVTDSQAMALWEKDCTLENLKRILHQLSETQKENDMDDLFQ